MTRLIKAFLLLFTVALLTTTIASAQPIDIGSRLELMIDDYLIENMQGAELRLHPPTPREVAITHGAPWEGNACGYYTVLQEGGLFRMYYRGHGYLLLEKKLASAHQEVICYAESTDGIRWTKPDLGLIAYESSTNNNIIWNSVGSHNFTPFIDTNPACRPDEKYKAFGGGGDGLYVLKSADGIHWAKLSAKPVITEGAFDSQNIGFWDEARGYYAVYFRTFAKIGEKRYRSIAVTTSQDLVTWTPPVPLSYPGAPNEQLYTNGILPYYRAPHILLGFPTRYVDRPLTEHMKTVEPVALRGRVLKSFPRGSSDLTDGLFMTSRDGLAFKRWDEVYLRPGLQQKGNWLYGNMYQGWGLVETPWDATGVGPISLEGVRAPKELSIYLTEGVWLKAEKRMRRYTMRIDGFVSMHAPLKGGEFVSKPLLFNGKELVINYSSSAAGSVRVEIQNPDGSPVAGYALADCPEIYGDTIEQVVSWTAGPDVSSLAGKPVRLRFVIKDADLYSLRFR
jgi:hypothetical protein